jgi:hypothetical protein
MVLLYDKGACACGSIERTDRLYALNSLGHFLADILDKRAAAVDPAAAAIVTENTLHRFAATHAAIYKRALGRQFPFTRGHAFPGI